MHTDSNRAHFSRDVTSLLGSVPFIMFIGQNNKGFCHFDAHNIHFSLGASYKAVLILFVFAGVVCYR